MFGLPGKPRLAPCPGQDHGNCHLAGTDLERHSTVNARGLLHRMVLLGLLRLLGCRHHRDV